MNEEEAAKLMAETIGESFSKYVGQSSNENTVGEILRHTRQVLVTFARIAEIHSPLPEIKVNVNKPERTVNVLFFDPKTEEAISIQIWFSRCKDGFYDRR